MIKMQSCSSCMHALPRLACKTHLPVCPLCFLQVQQAFTRKQQRPSLLRGTLAQAFPGVRELQQG